MQTGALTSVMRAKRGVQEDDKLASRTHLLDKTSSKNLLDSSTPAINPQISVTDLIRQERLKQSKKKSKPLTQRLWTFLMVISSLMVIIGGFSLLFIVPIVIDPAMATIKAQIHPQPVRCRTERVERLVSLQNCSWSSCREGCTRDIYHCIHVYVSLEIPTYLVNTRRESFKDKPHYLLPITSSVFSGMASSVYEVASTPRTTPLTLSSTTSSLSSAVSGPVGSDLSSLSPRMQVLTSSSLALLLVNIKTCGYPPRVNCSSFEKTYAVEGEEFSCFFSTTNSSVAITDFRPGEADLVMTEALLLPLTAIISGTVSICFLQLISLVVRKIAAIRKHNDSQHTKNKQAENETENPQTPAIEDPPTASEISAIVPFSERPIELEVMNKPVSASFLK